LRNKFKRFLLPLIMANDFLFHRVSEKEIEQIKKKSGVLLKKFSNRISKIPENLGEHSVERDEFSREEILIHKEDSLPFNRDPSRVIHKNNLSLPRTRSPTQEKKVESKDVHEGKEALKEKEDFRKRIFENAPNKNKDFIIAEKKKW